MYANKKILVLGLSKSGISAAKLLNKKGANVFLSEFREQKSEDEYKIKELEALGIKVEMGGHSDDFIQDVSLCITSPGIPPKSDVFKSLHKRKVPIISEVELAFLNTKTPFIVITGTNGKTTTTALTDHIISQEFLSRACGNIGLPPCDLVDQKLDFLVCELSSYQLEMSPTFAPKVALFTNFTPDHLDWHGGLENYFNAKAKIFKGSQSGEYCVLNAEDEKLLELGKSSGGTVFYFGKNLGDNCCYIENNSVIYKKDGTEEKVFELSSSPIVGYHNYQNIMAAIVCAKLAGVNNDTIVDAIKTFKTPEHRLEKVASYKGIDYYNDSKATNPEASLVAMRSFEGKKVALIAGGTDKLTSLKEFCDTANKYIKTVILIGEAQNRFEFELKRIGYNSIIKAKSLEEAIDKASELDIDVCLLSPACASFDMFTSYEHRGDVFKNYVLNKCND